ncbi:MAG: energy-coupling factor ABC transporter permease [Actinomycetota bacterium]|nr:energy-coupling factor ABC transporter permease [Actinomycetota bacterium]
MHIPDGFIDIPTSAAFAAVAAVGVAASLKGAAKSLDEKTAPLAGLTATFIFAVQMINFPVAAGTSGHLFGSVLAAVLVGPYVATLALSVVLLLQALLFADGGLTAAGLNVFNLSLVGVWVGYGAFLLVKKILPKNKPSITTAATIAGFISVPAAVMGFVLQYAIGANSTFSVTAVFAGMMSAHVLIGVGEAVITAFSVTAVMASRPDLVYGYRGTKAQLEIRKA